MRLSRYDYDDYEYDEEEEEPEEPQDDPNAKYPHIHVKLVGEDGNSFAILGRVRKALQRNGVPQEEIAKFTAEATSGDQSTLLRTCMEWVTVE